MNDKKQFAVYVLFIVNIIFCIVIIIGQAQQSREINNMMANSYYNLKVVSSDINAQLEETLKRDKFKAIDMDISFLGYLNSDGLMPGSVEFGLLDNKDVDKIYLIVDNDNTGESLKVKVISVGELRYKAEVELDYKGNYTYYIMSESAGGEKMMLSDMRSIELGDKVRDRASCSMEHTSIANDELSAKGRIYVNETLAEVVKVELKWMSFEDDAHMMGEGIESGVVIETIDITDRLFAPEEVNVNSPEMDDAKDYTEYVFDVTGKPTEGEYESLDFWEVIVVVTYSDGVEVEMFG